MGADEDLELGPIAAEGGLILPQLLQGRMQSGTFGRHAVAHFERRLQSELETSPW